MFSMLLIICVVYLSLPAVCKSSLQQFETCFNWISDRLNFGLNKQLFRAGIMSNLGRHYQKRQKKKDISSASTHRGEGVHTIAIITSPMSVHTLRIQKKEFTLISSKIRRMDSKEERNAKQRRCAHHTWLPLGQSRAYTEIRVSLYSKNKGVEGLFHACQMVDGKCYSQFPITYL